MEKQSIFQKKAMVPILAVTAMFVWGWAVPMIKLGFEQFQVAGDDTAAKTLFAGIRFVLAGGITLIAAKVMKRDFRAGTMKNWGWVALLALMDTALHYFFFYLGVSFSAGTRGVMLDSTSTFLLVVMGCLFFKDEHMTVKKVLGCVLGFGGLMVLNLGGDPGVSTLKGDVLLLANTVCAAFGSIIARVITRRMDAVAATGYSLAGGGAMLLICGLAMGGRLTVCTWQGLLILLMLVLISVVGFTIYNQLLRWHPVSEVAIYRALIPVFGAILSCLVLQEQFQVQYVLAGMLIAAGVVTVNR